MKQRVFCPVCNKGRKMPLPRTILSPTNIKDLVRCNCCKRLFQGDQEVEVKVQKKPPKGVDLRKMIPDWYKCPECGEVIVGWPSWAAHTAQKHGLSMTAFRKKFGKPKESYYGASFKEVFNPSER